MGKKCFKMSVTNPVKVVRIPKIGSLGSDRKKLIVTIMYFDFIQNYRGIEEGSQNLEVVNLTEITYNNEFEKACESLILLNTHTEHLSFL